VVPLLSNFSVHGRLHISAGLSSGCACHPKRRGLHVYRAVFCCTNLASRRAANLVVRLLGWCVGLIYGFFEKWFPEKFLSYWLFAILFGAIFPTLVLWFVVFPLKGIPVAAGWDQIRMATHVIIHGAWGLGMALLLRYRP
jgi:hypothetical protein